MNTPDPVDTHTQYRIEIESLNVTKNHQLFHVIEDPVREWYDNPTRPDGTLNTGKVYRIMREQYGRCTGKVYVDTADGAKSIGWVFVKREPYDDTRYDPKPDTFLRETWVSMAKVIEPARKEVWERVTM